MQKQNKKKRGIGALLALTSITACLVAGTFAKYTTSGTATGAARVAKFGVEIEVKDNTAFSASYDPKSEGAAEAGIYAKVTSSDGTEVVAPGTGEKDAITFSIKGRPETEVSIGAALDEEETQDIFLAKGHYKDYTNAPYDKNNFEITEEKGYHPIVFTLKENGNTAPVVTGSLEDINGYLHTSVAAESCGPNVEINKSYSLSWKWASEQSGDNAAAIDSADTLLGNIAADEKHAETAKYTPGMTDTGGTFSALTKDDYSTNLSLKLKLFVAQKFEASAI